jgi:hypothetical protein
VLPVFCPKKITGGYKVRLKKRLEFPAGAYWNGAERKRSAVEIA